MNEQKHQSYKRLFSIIKLINYGIEENKVKDDSRDVRWFVKEAVRKEDCDGKLKQQLLFLPKQKAESNLSHISYR